MLQRCFPTRLNRAAAPRRRRVSASRFHPAARYAVSALAAFACAACSSLQFSAASMGGARYSEIAPASTLRAPVAFASRSESSPRAASTLYARNIAIGDSTIAKTITRMRTLSPAFDSAVAALERSGIPVVIGTARQLKSQLPPGYAQVSGWQAVTAFYPLTPDGGRGRRIEHIAVVVRLAALESALRTDATTPDDSAVVERYLERVLAHEIYGHIMPQIAVGKTAPIACDDPTDGDDWYSACVMQRERHVAAQLSEARRAREAAAPQ
jgi:hypothetical protein